MQKFDYNWTKRGSDLTAANDALQTSEIARQKKDEAEKFNPVNTAIAATIAFLSGGTSIPEQLAAAGTAAVVAPRGNTNPIQAGMGGYAQGNAIGSAGDIFGSAAASNIDKIGAVKGVYDSVTKPPDQSIEGILSLAKQTGTLTEKQKSELSMISGLIQGGNVDEEGTKYLTKRIADILGWKAEKPKAQNQSVLPSTPDSGQASTQSTPQLPATPQAQTFQGPNSPQPMQYPGLQVPTIQNHPEQQAMPYSGIQQKFLTLPSMGMQKQQDETPQQQATPVQPKIESQSVAVNEQTEQAPFSIKPKDKSPAQIAANEKLLNTKATNITNQYLKRMTKINAESPSTSEGYKKQQTRLNNLLSEFNENQNLSGLEGTDAYKNVFSEINKQLDTVKLRDATLTQAGLNNKRADTKTTVIIQNANLSAQKSAMEIAEKIAAVKGSSGDAVSTPLVLVTGKLPGGGRVNPKDVQRYMKTAAEAGVSPEEITAANTGYIADSKSLARIQAQADAVSSFERTAQANIQLLQSIRDKYKASNGTTQMPWLDKHINAMREAMGNKDITALATATNAVANEVTKVVGGSTGSSVAPSDSARKDLQVIFNKNLADAQQEANNAVSSQEMLNRNGGYTSQIADINGRIASRMKPISDKINAYYGKGKIPVSTGSQPTNTNVVQPINKQTPTQTGKRYMVGKIYQGANNTKAIYQSDGTWKELP